MKYSVYHAIDPTFLDAKPRQFPQEFEKVAELECDNVDYVYELTNHIDQSWWKNDSITWHKPNSRSTSVGDVIVDANDNRTMVLGAGWKQI